MTKEFAARLALNPKSKKLLQGLPEDVRRSVMSRFKAPTEAGRNVDEQLRRFIAGFERRQGTSYGVLGLPGQPIAAAQQTAAASAAASAFAPGPAATATASSAG